LAKRKNNAKTPEASGATVGYEAQLWQMADALRGSMDAAEYKHVVLGLIFLKYISDAFEEQHARLVAEQANGADPEDPDEYRAQSIFWVPPEARWTELRAKARRPTIGQLVDDAMAGIERDNPVLKGVLPKNYTTWRLAKMNLAIRGIDGQIAHGDTFHNDRHPDLKADFILANPPFNISDWGGERLSDDRRWQYGTPPKGNANFAWVQHIARIANTYHAWRLPAPRASRQAGGESQAGDYADVPGFCKSASLDEVRKHGHVLTPGRYVGAEAQEDDGEPFEKKMKRLTAQLREQQAEAAKLDAAITVNLRELGFWSQSR
jgi:type I restriction-modification system DNA methylase subunit